ncbi:MAG: LysM peptidoglycan-binding domain-containing M23 family metallopeptidase [Chloroflexota bacterium]
MTNIPEPPIHDDDTSPSIAIRPVDFDARVAEARGETKPAGWQRAAGWLSLIGAGLFTLATLVVLLLPNNTPDDVPEVAQNPTEDVVVAPTNVPTDAPVVPTLVPTDETASSNVVADSLPPVIAPEQITIGQQTVDFGSSVLQQALYDPFTVIDTDRPRSGFIDYIVVQGDSINEIATRYGLQPESLAWCNDRRIVLVLRPGDVLRIPPVDGACHQVFGTREETITSIAEQYNVDDPFVIIDSDYNRGQLPPNITPNDVLLGNTQLFIPGGEGAVISWNAAAQQTDSSGNVTGVSFANGQSGSCGSVTPAGGAAWGNPLPNGRWVRGFYAGHSGIDLSAPTGTPIYAANSGNVIFSGFSRWGYGNAVVIEHGGVYSTLYGHMSSIAVGCGQFVSVGQVIGLVGNTGNSSGPHLHFEIMINGEAINPSGTPGIGW